MFLFDNHKFILASGSARRKDLLSEMGIKFDTIILDIDESYPSNIESQKVAEYISKKKFDSAKKFLKYGNEILITADTIVIDDNKILGKPKDIDDAKKIISSLGNKWHSVVTGVCLGNIHKNISFSCVSRVFVEGITDEELDYYVNNFSVLDKAGAYGIQDWIGLAKISKIEGSYTNIVGLPTQMLYSHLKIFENL